MISFRSDWLDLLAVQGTLKSFLQHYSWKASTLWRLVLFMVQLSHPYMTTGKTITLTIHTLLFFFCFEHILTLQTSLSLFLKEGTLPWCPGENSVSQESL